VSPSRISWSIVVAVCAVVVVVLALDGYVGYPIVVGAVGAAAAVNLL
jgi:hypothetical protein